MRVSVVANMIGADDVIENRSRGACMSDLRHVADIELDKNSHAMNEVARVQAWIDGQSKPGEGEEKPCGVVIELRHGRILYIRGGHPSCCSGEVPVIERKGRLDVRPV